MRGVGPTGLSAPPGPLYLGNSGTSMRLLAGVLAGQSFPSELVGDPSLSRRPMARIATPLRAMGADIATGDAGTPPLRIRGGGVLSGIDYDMRITPVRVGLTPTFSRTSSDPRAMLAPTRKKAAEEISPGTTTRVPRKRPPPTMANPARPEPESLRVIEWDIRGMGWWANPEYPNPINIRSV